MGSPLARCARLTWVQFSPETEKLFLKLMMLHMWIWTIAGILLIALLIVVIAKLLKK